MREPLKKAVLSLLEENNRLAGENSDLRSRNGYLDALVRETYHRTKNYLSVLMSALNIHGRSCTGTEAEIAIREARSMIMTVVTLNEMLSLSDTLKNISTRHYISKLARRVFEVCGGKKGIILKLEVEEVQIPADLMLPCGMVINELIVNALKHAFPRLQGGTVIVSLTSVKGGKVRLSVKDDGCGVYTPRDNSMGLNMVKVLSEQLGGTLKVTHKNGTECSVVFKA